VDGTAVAVVVDATVGEPAASRRRASRRGRRTAAGVSAGVGIVGGTVVGGTVVGGTVVVGGGGRGGGTVVGGTVVGGTVVGGGAVVVVVVGGAARSARGATVTTPSPRMANGWGPWTASAASNRASASLSDTAVFARAGGGVTSRSPWSRSTDEA